MGAPPSTGGAALEPGLLGHDGFYNQAAHNARFGQGPEPFQPQPHHHSLSPGRGKGFPPETGAGRRVVFDKMVAKNPPFQYDSNSEERWKTTVKNYLIGERWEIRDLLDWAERFDKITIEELQGVLTTNHPS